MQEYFEYIFNDIFKYDHYSKCYFFYNNKLCPSFTKLDDKNDAYLKVIFLNESNMIIFVYHFLKYNKSVLFKELDKRVADIHLLKDEFEEKIEKIEKVIKFDKYFEKLYFEEKTANEDLIKEFNLTDPNFLGTIYEKSIHTFIEKILEKIETVKLRIVSGKIYDPTIKKQSNQIDKMLVLGECIKEIDDGLELYSIENVIATVESKKTYGKEENNEAIENSFSIADLVKEYEAHDINLGGKYFFNKFNIKNECLYYECTMELYKPVTIIFGFDGWKKEKTLIKNFLDKFEENINFGLYRFPDLIISGDCCITKLNGPFILKNNNQITYFSSIKVDNLLKMYLFKMYILEAISRKLIIKGIDIEIDNLISNNPFEAKPIIDMKIEGYDITPNIIILDEKNNESN
jgi:hypothetical protein